MKKLICIVLCFLAAAGCDSAESFKGREFVLANAYPDSVITIGFAERENRFFGKVVNRFFGTYAADKDTIRFGRVGATMMMGPPRKMRDEAEFFALLPAVQSYRFARGALVLRLADGQEWIFKPQEKQ